MRLETHMRQVARDEWNLGVVPQTLNDIIHRGIVTPIHWLKPNSWRILADPFCYRRPDGRFVILAEKLNHWTGRGEIWQAVLPRDGQLDISDFHLYAKSRIHLSYPHRMTIHGADYFTMESHETGGLHLWQIDEDQTRHVGRLLDRPAVDTTFYCGDRYLWMFCSFADDGPNEKLHLFYSKTIAGPWHPHQRNPVKVDIASARPAGQLFRCQAGRLIRPAQDCSATYGAALHLNHVLRLTPDEFKEVPLLRIDPSDPYYCNGLHTIADAGDFTLIDGKRWHSNMIENLACRVAAKVWKVRRQFINGRLGPDWQFAAPLRVS